VVAGAEALVLTDEQRGGLERLARSHSAPVREVRQAKALLWAADGASNAEIARRAGATTKSVRRWRGRGRPVEIDASVVAAIVADTLHWASPRFVEGC
jgi:hypothetical protein